MGNMIKKVDRDEWWKTSRVARALKYVDQTHLAYWANLGLLNFTRFGTTHRFFNQDEVHRIAIMGFLVVKGGMAPTAASKVATHLAKADIVEGVLWGKFNKMTIGIPIEEIYSEAFSN